MTPEEQRIAIAEHCGWVRIPQAEFHRLRLFMETKDKAKADKKFWIDNMVPDYLNDLNLMQEAFMCLTAIQQQHFVSILRNICAFKGCWPECATAAQHAEAFLRTVNKWDEK